MPHWADQERRHEIHNEGRLERILNFVNLKGQPLSFNYHPFLPAVYTSPLTDFMFMAGRQVSKSTTLSILISEEMMTHPYFSINYLTPLKEQTARFSTMYLKPMLEGSPAIKDIFMGSSSEQNVFRKQFVNGAVCNLQYAFLDAERIRGTPADRTMFDEVQDMIWENIPVIKECMGFSNYKWEAYTGTAKTLDNTIEKLWTTSTRREWVMKCTHCDTHNIPAEPWIHKMIREHGFSCYKCGQLLNVANGEWIMFNKNAYRDGFHIPQVIVPKNIDVGNPMGWQKIWQKKLEYPVGKFCNEVLGISYDTGGRLITLSEIKERCCKDYIMESSPPLNHGCRHFVIGVDWGISAQTSYTVAVVMGILPAGTVKVFAAVKFLGTDIMEQINQIIMMAQAYGADLICADFGVGYTNNQILRQQYGGRVMEFQYVRQRAFLKWDAPSKRYMLSRTASMNILFMNMKAGLLYLPRFDDIEPFVKDILSVYEEVVDTSGSTVKVFLHTPDVPDDFVHALNFGWVGLRKLVNDPILALEVGESV